MESPAQLRDDPVSGWMLGDATMKRRIDATSPSETSRYRLVHRGGSTRRPS